MGDKTDATTGELVGMAEVINSRLAEILPHQRVRVWRAAVGDYCRAGPVTAVEVESLIEFLEEAGFRPPEG